MTMKKDIVLGALAAVIVAGGLGFGCNRAKNAEMTPPPAMEAPVAEPEAPAPAAPAAPIAPEGAQAPQGQTGQ